MNRLRMLGALAALVVLIIAASAVIGRGGAKRAPAPSENAAAPARAPTVAAAPAGATPTPLVVPTPAIPLPKNCPSGTIPEVDNPARYTFCLPFITGWGAYNNNNSLSVTQAIKARPGGRVLSPTDFSRIEIALNLDVGAPASPPAACTGSPNDMIDAFPAHFCSAPLAAASNPYMAVKAEFWMIDLSNNRHFYITALLGPDVTQNDEAIVSGIVHTLIPPQP